MIRINLAPGRGIARGGVVADLGGSCFCNGLSNQVNRLPMLLVAFMRTQTYGKNLFHLPNVFVALRRQGRCSFIQSRSQGSLDLCTLQWLQKITTEKEGHELGSRKTERRDIAEALHKLPSGLTV